MTVVIDCNILVMCITSRSPYHIIYKSLISGKFDLAISTDIALEYEEVIQQKYSVHAANAFIKLLIELKNVHLINQYYQWKLIEKDLDDNKYSDCAIAGHADCLVTEDRHFDILKNIPFPSVSIMGIDTFSNMLRL